MSGDGIWEMAAGRLERGRMPYVLHCSALAGQKEWIASASELESSGCSLFTTLAPGAASVVITRAKTAFPLRRTTQGSLYLDGSVGVRGTLTVPPEDGAPLVSLLVDTGAHISIVGEGGHVHLSDWRAHDREVYGVGGIAVQSAGAGRLTVDFRTPGHGLWGSGRALTVFGEPYAVKVLRTDHTSAPWAFTALQTANVRVALAAPEAVTGAGAARPSRYGAGRAMRKCGGTMLTAASDVVERLGITNPRVLKELHTFVHGVAPLSPSGGSGMDPE